MAMAGMVHWKVGEAGMAVVMGLALSGASKGICHCFSTDESDLGGFGADGSRTCKRYPGIDGLAAGIH